MPVVFCVVLLCVSPLSVLSVMESGTLAPPHPHLNGRPISTGHCAKARACRCGLVCDRCMLCTCFVGFRCCGLVRRCLVRRCGRLSSRYLLGLCRMLRRLVRGLFWLILLRVAMRWIGASQPRFALSRSMSVRIFSMPSSMCFMPGVGLIRPDSISSLIHWATISSARAEPMRSDDFMSGSMYDLMWSLIGVSLTCSLP